MSTAKTQFWRLLELLTYRLWVLAYSPVAYGSRGSGVCGSQLLVGSCGLLSGDTGCIVVAAYSLCGGGWLPEAMGRPMVFPQALTLVGRGAVESTISPKGYCCGPGDGLSVDSGAVLGRLCEGFGCRNRPRRSHVGFMAVGGSGTCGGGNTEDRGMWQKNAGLRSLTVSL